MQLHNLYTRTGSILLSYSRHELPNERQSEIFLSGNEIIAILWTDRDFVEKDTAVN